MSMVASFIIPKIGTSLGSCHREKQTVTYLYNGMVFSNLKDTTNRLNVYESQKYYAEWKKPYTGHTL